LFYVFVERYFTEKHEWVDVDNSMGKIGITDYAQVIVFVVITDGLFIWKIMTCHTYMYLTAAITFLYIVL